MQNNCSGAGAQAWVMVSTVLVLGMSPGLALFEAGLIRLKNTVSFVAQIFTGVAVLSIMWLLFGFSLSHGQDNGGFIGDFANGMFTDVSYTRCYPGLQISEASYATFMMMFAIISPLLMTGAYAERLPFPAFICITVMWELFVYYPVSHWVSAAQLARAVRCAHSLTCNRADLGRRLACLTRCQRLRRGHRHTRNRWQLLPRRLRRPGHARGTQQEGRMRGFSVQQYRHVDDWRQHSVDGVELPLLCLACAPCDACAVGSVSTPVLLLQAEAMLSMRCSIRTLLPAPPPCPSCLFKSLSTRRSLLQ